MELSVLRDEVVGLSVLWGECLQEWVVGLTVLQRWLGCYFKLKEVIVGVPCSGLRGSLFCRLELVVVLLSKLGCGFFCSA